MKFQDRRIGTQLAVGLGIILAMVALLGVIVIVQEESLWEDTAGLYEHPLQVRMAIGELSTDILYMHRGMKDLALTDNEKEKAHITGEIDAAEANAYRQFDLLYALYLGPRSDIDRAYNDFVVWKSIRTETLRLLQEGERAAAINRTRPDGPGGGQVDTLMTDIAVMSEFSKTRGDQFYESAQKKKADLTLELVLLLAIILLISIYISYTLIRNIRNPLLELTGVTEQYRSGNQNARSGIVSGNETGKLAASFNSLADTVQAELQAREDAAGISRVMLKETELKPFCQELLVVLMRYTGSQVGAVFLLNDQRTSFVLFESVGLSSAARTSFSATEREGEFGAALASREVSHIRAIPEDTAFTLCTVSGDIRPKEVLTIPVVSGTDVVAVISLANVRAYSPSQLRLVSDIRMTLTARFNGVLSYRKVQVFGETLEHQNRELGEKSRELALQGDELREQNIELDIQRKELAEANQAKTVFLSNMSHELRTPLNSVIALSGVLSRRLKEMVPEEELGYLEVIQRNGKHLLSLINDILDIARIESGREEVSLRTFPVQELVADVIGMMAPQAREKGITLVSRVSPDLPRLTSDYAKCLHILENLVANAVKFTETGEVSLGAMAVGGELHMPVTDTGIGIEKSHIGFIFDEFRQADESITRKFGGTGLGLSIAKKYATLLSGRITVRSTPGEGSVFTLVLPWALTLGEGPVSEAETVPVTQDVPVAGRTVLLVEDSEPAIIQVRELLEEEGYRVRVARNGKEALDEIGKDLPDAVILDLMMPLVDGFSVLRMVRSREETARLPVLILTAKHVTKEELSFLKENHVYQLIQKGDINRAELLRAVRGMVSGTKVPPRRRERPVILVVEDNPDNMMTTRALLKERYTVIGATDGRSGLALAHKERPDLVLLDISLPVMDGFAVLAGIRGDEAIRDTPVIALTARATKGDRDEILSRGFNGYLSKPVDGDLLEEAIRRVLYGS